MLAQIPNTSATELGAWLVAAAALVAIIVLCLTAVNQWRRLLARPRKRMIPLAAQYVTKAELDKLELATKTELQRIETSLTAQLSRNEEYAHSRFHELGDAVQKVALDLACVPGRVRETVDMALIVFAEKLDRNTATITQVLARLQAQEKAGEK